MIESRSNVLPRVPAWSREWVVLERRQTDYLESEAERLRVTPSAVVRKLVDDAVLAARRSFSVPGDDASCADASHADALS